VLTAQPSGSAAELADAVVVLPAQTMADDIVAPAGSTVTEDPSGNTVTPTVGNTVTPTAGNTVTPTAGNSVTPTAGNTVTEDFTTTVADV